MDERDHRIDEHVRSAAPVSQQILAELTDQAMQEALLRRILVDAPPAAAITRRTWMRPRWALAAAAVLALIIGGGTLLGQGWLGGATATSTARPLDHGGVAAPSSTATSHADGGVTSCIFPTAEVLTRYTDLAFDGTVVAIAPSPVRWLGSPTVEVTFAVWQWFRGPGGHVVTVRMVSPEVSDNGLLHWGYLPYATGSRMLVAGFISGTELHAGGCGWTRHYLAGGAAVWARAFAATPSRDNLPTTR